MDALYLFKHSRHADIELRYSLRSIHQHAEFLETIWVFGDKPGFLKVDHPRIRHVSHEYTARSTGVRTPIVNTFLLLFHAALIPELSYEFLWFCDDYILLKDLEPEVAKRDRYVERLRDIERRGKGVWKESLWRTHELLERLGYSDFNFESHTPTYFTKKRVFEAYCEFRDFVTEDRWYGMLASTGILNHALRDSPLELTHRDTEGIYAGFYHKAPRGELVESSCRGKTFLNFDDDAFGPALEHYLQERFPEPCSFEVALRGESQPQLTSPTPTASSKGYGDPPIAGGVFLPPNETR